MTDKCATGPIVGWVSNCPMTNFISNATITRGASHRPQGAPHAERKHPGCAKWFRALPSGLPRCTFSLGTSRDIHDEPGAMVHHTSRWHLERLRIARMGALSGGKLCLRC